MPRELQEEKCTQARRKASLGLERDLALGTTAETSLSWFIWMGEHQGIPAGAGKASSLAANIFRVIGLDQPFSTFLGAMLRNKI